MTGALLPGHRHRVVRAAALVSERSPQREEREEREDRTAARWRPAELAGRLCELAADAHGAQLTLACAMIRDYQRAATPRAGCLRCGILVSKDRQRGPGRTLAASYHAPPRPVLTSRRCRCSCCCGGTPTGSAAPPRARDLAPRPGAGYPAPRRAAPAAMLALKARATPLPAGQSELFRANPRRDLAAGSAALASLRAQFGNAAVAHAVLAAEHLPEAQFRWQPVTELTPPRPRGAARSGQREAPPLVRRVLAQPVEVPPPRGGSGPQPARYGPFLISNGWWRAAEPREGGGAYYFLRSPGGTLEWLYHDLLTRRWYRQGRVE